jgi:hypothetical protein
MLSAKQEDKLAADKHKVFVYAPPESGAPHVVVITMEGQEPQAQFANSSEEAKKMADQAHALLWRAQHVLKGNE